MVTVKRIAENQKASLGTISFNSKVICGSVEDPYQETKIKGNTRISNGKYKLALRDEGGFNSRYKIQFASKGKDWHKGMLCIYNMNNWVINCPDGKVFQYCLIHIGNSSIDTNGCLLPNMVLNFSNMNGSSSRVAYEKLYPILRDAILESEKGYIEIEFKN